VKSVYPDAHITYSRRHNKRADDRHPEPSLYETQPIRAAKTRRSVKAPRRRAR
jgi:hypothetical protein